MSEVHTCCYCERAAFRSSMICCASCGEWAHDGCHEADGWVKCEDGEWDCSACAGYVPEKAAPDA